MSKKELVKRYILCAVSLFVSALGVALTKHGELGMSPISSVSNILSIKFTSFSLGSWLIIWNCILILGQIVVLRKKFQLIQLLQIPLSFLFGWFTDICMIFVNMIPVESYIMKMTMVISGIIVLGYGIALAVIANVIMNSGEAFVKAVSDVTGKQFGNLKIAFDVLCVVVSIILSMLFFKMKIYGVREGTVISAIFTGILVKFFTKISKSPVEKLLTKQIR